MYFKVNNRDNKNPKVDLQAEETLLHYLAWRSNNAFLFESIAEKVDNWFCYNRNGDTPIDIAASRVHIYKNILKKPFHSKNFQKLPSYFMLTKQTRNCPTLVFLCPLYLKFHKATY